MSIPIVDPRIAASAYSDDPIQKKLQIDELKKHIEGGKDKDKQLREACEGFEAVFIQKIWEQMRNSIPKDGYLHSRDEEMYQSMFDTEFSKKMASAGGIGLSDMLYEQLNIKLGKASRATSPSMLRNQQEMKGIDQNKGIELEPRYGSLKRDPETERVLSASGRADPNGVYDEFKEEGLEYVNPYTREGFTGAVAAAELRHTETAAETAENPAAENQEGEAAPQQPWQGLAVLQRGISGFSAYTGNLGQDVNAVGSISAARQRQAEASGVPMSLGARIADAQATSGSSVKFIDPAATGGSDEVRSSPDGLINQNPGQVPEQIPAQASVQTAQPDIPGFTGMKPPFPGVWGAAGQTPLGYNFSNMVESVTFKNVENLSAPVQGTNASQIAPDNMVAPAAGMSQHEVQSGGFGAGQVNLGAQISPTATTARAAQAVEADKAQPQDVTENSIPAGMFRRFDTVPEI